MQPNHNSHQPPQENQQEQHQETRKRRSKLFLFKDVSRRSFLAHASLFSATSIVTGLISSNVFSKNEDIVQAQEFFKLPRNFGRQFNYVSFRQKAFQVRVQAAQNNQQIEIPPHPTNGDEERYPNKIATDTRGLPHDQRGEVDLKAYDSLIKALTTQNPEDFENIILGGTRKLVNPQGPLAVSLEGVNATQISVPSPPTLDSVEQAAEAVELYWQALLRDVPFQNFDRDANVAAAIAELNSLPGFSGPKENGSVTPQTLFRGNALYVDQRDRSGRTGRYVTPPGVLDGPYISQFLLREIPYNTQFISPLIRTALATKDNTFLINYDEWLTVQNGRSSGRSITFDPTRRFVYTVRDLGELARIGGALFFGASLILSSTNAPLNPGNPYLNSKTQVGSAATFAPAHFQALLNLAPSRAIRASYWQKFYVHRRLRPEAYGGLIYNNLVNKTNYPINNQVLNSTALARTFSTFGTYLLPHAYPEGAPFHSSYTGGAASIAGVQATLLKAFFDETFILPNPVEPDPNDPTKLIPYSGSPLTVGGELNKLAANYYIGRGNGGIHWRSDGAAGLVLGEQIAISILRDERLGFNERFGGFTFTKFDGTKITV
ncbi:vanadium-dependent haloperoxidase [Anabaena azotica]|uniref:Vanadium-dependent haloperoxidase n=1 Tax=Anabaena azotica FACHB-119 TaxID=947527 RepID=A0ABR8D141_9NOST|nr:vanadium-dependent haloperoxidase [Anabaena azotica]MBD2500128.1 vanadium-dependent haloperoxidase [Anabaena azotica FACHB-119]